MPTRQDFETVSPNHSLESGLIFLIVFSSVYAMPTNVCKLFSYSSKPIHGLLALNRRPIDLQ